MCLLDLSSFLCPSHRAVPLSASAGVNGLLTDFPSSQSCGFCLFNNAMIGSLHALEAHPDAVQRVAIVDIGALEADRRTDIY